MSKDVWEIHLIIVVKHFESLRESQDHKIYWRLLIRKSSCISQGSESFVVHLLFCGFPKSSQVSFTQFQGCDDVLSCVPNDDAIIKLTHSGRCEKLEKFEDFEPVLR